MKLLLTSGGLSNESLKNTLREMLGKPTSECKLVFIPTAYNGTGGDMTWLVNDVYQAHQMRWREFRLLDSAVKATWDKKLWWPHVEEADVLYVGGGNPAYLSYWLQQAGLFETLPDLLTSKVYVGSSAGSMVVTPGLRVSSGALKNAPAYEFPLDDPTVPTGQVSPAGLGLVDFYVRPHWGVADPKHNFGEETMRKAYQVIGKPIYLLDDQSALRVEDGTVQVVSEGKWLLIDKVTA